MFSIITVMAALAIGYYLGKRDGREDKIKES